MLLSPKTLSPDPARRFGSVYQVEDVRGVVKLKLWAYVPSCVVTAEAFQPLKGTPTPTIIY